MVNISHHNASARLVVGWILPQVTMKPRCHLQRKVNRLLTTYRKQHTKHHLLSTFLLLSHPILNSIEHYMYGIYISLNSNDFQIKHRVKLASSTHDDSKLLTRSGRSWAPCGTISFWSPSTSTCCSPCTS